MSSEIQLIAENFSSLDKKFLSFIDEIEQPQSNQHLHHIIQLCRTQKKEESWNTQLGAMSILCLYYQYNRDDLQLQSSIS